MDEKNSAIGEEATNLLMRDFTRDHHELALEDDEMRGAVQTHQATESEVAVRDLGWHKPPLEVIDPLIGGVPNARLWAMIRRFNKDVFDVRAVTVANATGLDLNEAWDEEYATDKWALHLQRFYLAIVLDLASLFKHISRLRSWKETRRTAAFCFAYFTAWHFDLLIQLVLGAIMVIIASKQACNLLFPLTPLSLVDINTGGLQKPPAGQLGSLNSLTGAPEKQEGEAVEEEAANFVDNLRHLVQWAIGMHQKQEQNGNPLESKIPKPIRNAAKSIKEAGSSAGHATHDTDQTQKPMEEILWSGLKPENLAVVVNRAPHIIGEIVDNWERFANALSPTPPYSRFSFIRIEGVLLPLFLVSFFISTYMVYKGVGFAIGFGIFGDPILNPALKRLNQYYPQWTELLEPKKTFLRGVPTNNQLTLTLLRIGEAHNTPIPPVPSSKPDDPDHHTSINIDKVPLAASRTEVADAIQPSSTEKADPDDESDENKSNVKHKHLSRVIAALKRRIGAVVETKLAVDHIRAARGSEQAKGNLGILPKRKDLVYAGPSDFKARFDGKKGWVYITSTSPPSISFTTHDVHSDAEHEKTDPVFEVPVSDIRQLRRAMAFTGTVIEKAADWSPETELLGSIEMIDSGEKTWRLTAMPERDELFNRLIAIGSQRWENM